MRDKETSIAPDIGRVLGDVLTRGGSFRFQARGFSMSPFIKAGDVVTVSPLSPDSARLGEVVAMSHPQTGILIIHRVIGRVNGSVITRGDNTLKSDGEIRKQYLFGYVKKVERNGKRVYLGLGPERVLIALLSRNDLLVPIVLTLWRIKHRFTEGASS